MTHHATTPTIAYYRFTIGLIRIVCADGYLIKLDYLPSSALASYTWVDATEVPIRLHPDSTLQERVPQQLQAYFAGRLRDFDLPIHLMGTPFQVQVWNALRQIPYGKTSTYRDIAEAIGCPHGYRAVGMANHNNPIPFVVPCHRVINASGQLGGYAYGLPLKLRLLEMEQDNKTIILKNQ